jgi:hypothetical protein
LPKASTSTPAVGQAEEARAMLKFQKDMRTYWDWQARFNDWMENQFIYCFPDGKALAMPPFPRELLEADVFQEDIQKANPDMPEPSAKSPKKSKKKKKKKK